MKLLNLLENESMILSKMCTTTLLSLSKQNKLYRTPVFKGQRENLQTKVILNNRQQSGRKFRPFYALVFRPIHFDLEF